jgi:Rrf2 family protein
LLRLASYFQSVILVLDTPHAYGKSSNGGLGKLSGAGLVRSYKGNRGGYELAHASQDITLRDVLVAVEGPFAISRYQHKGACSRGVHGVCSFQQVYNRISESVEEQLQQVSFAMLIDEEMS